MSEEEKIFKAKFNRLLEPVKVMLVNRKRNLPRDEWMDFVNLTKVSVIGHPDQYLGSDLPKPAVLFKIINTIFEDFLADQATRVISR